MNTTNHEWTAAQRQQRPSVCVPVLIGEDLLTVFALVDGLVAVLPFLLEVLSQRVKDGAGAGARVLLMPPQLERRGEQLVAVFTAVHLLVWKQARACLI